MNLIHALQPGDGSLEYSTSYPHWWDDATIFARAALKDPQVHEVLCRKFTGEGPWSWSWLAQEITCPICRVLMDQLQDKGEFFTRATGEIYWPEEPEYESLGHFTAFLSAEERSTYTVEELQKICKNAQMSTGKVREALASVRFTLEPRAPDKKYFKPYLGSTFGFAGLKK